MRKVFKFSTKAFTLIELLVVIAVLGVMAVALLTAINPVKKINAGKDSTLKSDMGQLANAIQASFTGSNGATYATTLAGLLPNELKSLPKTQAGSATCTDGAGAHAAGNDYCYNGAATTAVLWGMMFDPPTGKTVWCLDSATGQFNATTTPAATATACP